MLIPVTGWGLLHGMPIGLAGGVVLSAVWWLWFVGGQVPGRTLILALLAAKCIAGPLLLVEHGFKAYYFANDNWAAPVEQSTDFRSAAFTRVDCRLVFGTPDGLDFPLFFFNDTARFNFYRDSDPDRAKLPFSVRWQGDLRATGAETTRTFFLRGRGVSAQLWVNGVLTADLKPSSGEVQGQAPARGGTHRLVVLLRAPYGSSRQFVAGSVDVDTGREEPFEDADVVVRRVAPWRMAADQALGMMSALADLALLALLGWSATVTGVRLFSEARAGRRADARLALGWAAAMAGGVVFAWPAAGTLTLLEGGSDYLTYEYYARSIVLEGPLMLLGRPVGQAAPFYFQPLYPYVLALVHVVFGEDLAGVYFAQWLLALATVVCTWRISSALFGSRVGAAGLLLGGVYFAWKLVPLAGLVLTENVFIPLLAIWTLLLVRAAAPDAPSRTAVSAGIVGGLATLARSTLIAGWAVALPILVRGRRQAGMRGRAVAAIAVIMLSVMGLAGFRNLVASGSFTLLPTSGPVNLYLGNQAPPEVPSHQVSEHAFYRWFTPGEHTRMVIEFAIHAPGLFLRNLGNKALYSLGVFSAYAGGEGISVGLIATWLAALIGVGVMAWGYVPGPHSAVRWLPAGLSLSQFAVVTLVFPNVYVDRLILPIYILLLPYAAVALAWATTLVSRPSALQARHGAGPTTASSAAGRVFRAVVLFVGITCLTLFGVSAVIRSQTSELVPTIKIRWKVDVTTAQRTALERRLMLSDAEQIGPSTWSYGLLDLSASNIRAIVRHESVEDTDDLDRGDEKVSGRADRAGGMAWVIHRQPFVRQPLLLDYGPAGLLLAGISCLAGAALWRRRTPSRA